jgi:hypothetical protein
MGERIWNMDERKEWYMWVKQIVDEFFISSANYYDKLGLRNTRMHTWDCLIGWNHKSSVFGGKHAGHGLKIGG